MQKQLLRKGRARQTRSRREHVLLGSARGREVLRLVNRRLRAQIRRIARESEPTLWPSACRSAAERTRNLRRGRKKLKITSLLNFSSPMFSTPLSPGARGSRAQAAIAAASAVVRQVATTSANRPKEKLANLRTFSGYQELMIPRRGGF